MDPPRPWVGTAPIVRATLPEGWIYSEAIPILRRISFFLGNSITAGVDWMELLGRADVRNRGISGDISFGVLERLHEVTEGKPARVFILIGINDISRNIPDSVIIDNYRRMIRIIRQASPATKIFFQTLMPVNNQFTQFKKPLQQG